MKKLLFVPIIILGLFMSGNVFAETSTLYPNDPIACTMEYAPVCGESQYQCPNPLHPEQPCATVVLPPTLKTYSNACAMRADGAKLVHQGVCGENEKPTFCTMEYAPVCGEKQVQCVKAPCYPIQKTYSNQCMMNADNNPSMPVSFLHTGECIPETPVKKTLADLPDSCTSANDGCNNCSRSVGGQWMCTMMACVVQGEARCTSDTKSSLPNFCNGNKFSKMNRGMRGDMVRALQEFLFGQGYIVGTIDGSFGLKTHKAVKDFQTAKGLKSDGVFGNNSKFAVCNKTTYLPITIPSYTVEINNPKSPMLIGGTTSNMDIVINVSNMSESKSVEMIIEYNTGIPNPQYYTSKRETKRITTSKLVNGSNTISDVMIGSVVSVTIDGQSVPFTKNY